MGTVDRPIVTKPLPRGAEIVLEDGHQVAKWKDRRGRPVAAPVIQGNKGEARIQVRSGTYVAKYVDSQGVYQKVSTGCRDETAARAILAEHERRVELVKAGIMTSEEASVADHQKLAIEDHIEEYTECLAATCKPGSDHPKTTRACLLKVTGACEFRRLSDLNRSGLERWLAREVRAGRSARSRNAHLVAMKAFANWCIEDSRLIANPFARISKANEKADPRRPRRALDERTLALLLEAARRRPLENHLMIRRGKRKGQPVAKVKPANRRKLLQLGRERALIYKTCAFTGLRRKELKSLTVISCCLDEPRQYLRLAARDEKSGRGAELPLQHGLAEELREWLADKLAGLQDEARSEGRPPPQKLPPDTPLFHVPAGLLRLLNRDLEFAGIPKKDDRGHTFDVHGLRKTFGTLLAVSGVHPRVAQEAMRHSTIDLTMNLYTDPRFLDVSGAMDRLPALPLSARSKQDRDEDQKKKRASAG